MSLKSEVKKLQLLTKQLEPFIEKFSTSLNANNSDSKENDVFNHHHWEIFDYHIGRLQQEFIQPILLKEYQDQENYIANNISSYTKGRNVKFYGEYK